MASLRRPRNSKGLLAFVWKIHVSDFFFAL
jgi:hypothetical protein